MLDDLLPLPNEREPDELLPLYEREPDELPLPNEREPDVLLPLLGVKVLLGCLFSVFLLPKRLPVDPLPALGRVTVVRVLLSLFPLPNERFPE